MEAVKRPSAGARAAFVVLLTFLVPLLGACGSSSNFDPSTPEGKQAIIDATNNYLSASDCTNAVETIKPLYNSVYTDNTVRMIMASAYGCYAGINFFSLIGDLASNSAYLSGASFWSLLAKLFPSTSIAVDRVVEAGLLGQDSLLAVLKPGTVMLPSTYINYDSVNPGSGVASDRTSDSNIYQVFMTMATIGGMENRFGEPSSATHVKTVDLPWTTATYATMTTDGCAFGASLVNFADAVGEVAATTSGSLATSFQALDTAIRTVIYGACDAGCVACGGSCPTCPQALRDRAQCAGTATDMPSCAVAKLTDVINTAWIVAVP